MNEQCTTCKFAAVGERNTIARGLPVPTIDCALDPVRVPVEAKHWCSHWLLKPTVLPPANPPLEEKKPSPPTSTTKKKAARSSKKKPRSHAHQPLKSAVTAASSASSSSPASAKARPTKPRTT